MNNEQIIGLIIIGFSFFFLILPALGFTFLLALVFGPLGALGLVFLIPGLVVAGIGYSFYYFGSKHAS